MNRFERYHRSYDYNNASAHSSWDTKTSIGVEQGDDDDAHSRVNLTRRPAASVIGYDDLDFWPRTRPNTRDRDRDRNRNRDLNSPRLRQRDGHGHRASLRPSLSSGPTLTTGTSTTTTDREWEKERDFSNLKQRLSLAGRSPPSLTFISGNYPHHHRARSLSLTRLSASAAGSVYSDISSSSLEDDEDDSDMEPWWGSTGRGRQGRGHRVLPLAPGSPPLPRRHRQTTDSPSPKYYRHARLSLSPPERHERGYQVVPAPVPPPTCVSVGGGAARDETAAERHADDLRARLGGLDVRERLPNPRVSSSRHHAGHARKRSESYERFKGVRNGRKGLSPAAGARANSKHRGLKPQYNQVHALILTWSFHDLRTEDYTAPPASDYVSLEEETAQLRGTLEGYGYTVHEFLIPMHRSVERLKAKLKQFCRYAADDTLLIVYYHGHGALDGDNELVFSSHDHPENPEWAKAAAAELYAALMCGDTCSTHGRRDKYQELLKKYERYRPVSTIKWDTLRGPILSAPCDVLLVLDCCAAGGANLRHINWQPPPGTEVYTKHLFAACGFESSTSDDMTAAMCEVLHEWVPSPPPPPPAAGGALRRSASVDAVAGTGGVGGVGGGGGGGGGGEGRGVPVGGGQFLTTKRLHQLMEDKLQKRSVGSQPIFKQLLPQDPEQYITLPDLRRGDGGDGLKMGERKGRRRYVVA